MIQDFLMPFLLVGLAELGDKTQIAVFCLSTKTKKYMQLLLGALLAFALADGLAVLLGDFITKIVPIQVIRIASGTVFITFGILTLLNKDEDELECNLKNPFISSFGLVFLSELGDKTQISAALFATKYNPILVFLGIIASLALLSILAIYFGKMIKKKINNQVLSKIAGIIFIIMGLLFWFF